MPHRTWILAFILLLNSISCNAPSESELQGTVASYGFDYDQLKARARSDANGLRGFFLLGLITDAAASEDYCSELGRLLEYWGEERFLEALESTATSPREQVLS